MFDKSKIDDKKFEELCLQIAKEEFFDKGEFIPINGIGGDGGREFYLKLENGDRWSWQCKLFNKLDNPQKKQIKESLKTCLRNDGNKLKKRFLCIPIDLTDTIKQKNNTTKKGAREFIDELKKENNGLEIITRLKSDFDTFCIKYPLINNYFFGDEKQIREAEIEIINKEDNKNAIEQAEIDKQQINTIFLGGKDEDIKWSKIRYYSYNLQKLRCIDHQLITDDIKEIEESINVDDLDIKKYENFQSDFQSTVSNYFGSFKTEKEILETSYRYALNNIGKQIGCILTKGINGDFKFHYNDKSDFYTMNIKNG